MAQPPTTDVNETFLREVDENLRRDRAHDFFRDNKALLIGAVLLFLAAAGAMIWWQDYRQRKAGEQVEQLATVYRDISAGKTKGAEARLEPLTGSSSDAVRASALFTQAALALDGNDTAKASQLFGRIAGDSGLPKPYRDAATLRQVALDFDKLKPADAIARLDPLAQPGGPWFGSAGELKAAALIKLGKRREAGQLFAAIAADKSVPETLRARSVQIAGSLGVDASAALDAAPAQ